MKYLIVNADDFGMTPGINQAVIDGHTRGIITSATIMANMPAFDEAVNLARMHPGLGVGLHFNLTQGAPLTHPSGIESLLNSAGLFHGTSTALARKALLGRLKKEDVIVELRSQIEKVLGAGLRLTHIDSHKHAHALPLVSQAIIETIPQYGILSIRLPDERSADVSITGAPALLKQRLVAGALSFLCRRIRPELGQVKTTDNFHGITRTGYWTRDWLMSLFDRLGDGTSELMCHPGYLERQSSSVKTRLTRSRLSELELLTDPELKTHLAAREIQLVNFDFLFSGERK